MEPGDDRDGAEEEGPGARGAAEFHPLFGLVQEAVDGAGTDFFEFIGDRIGHAAGFSQSDEVKVLPEEGGEQCPAGPVEVFRACKKFCVNGYTTRRRKYGLYKRSPG
jgi:hypothetical protein